MPTGASATAARATQAQRAMVLRAEASEAWRAGGRAKTRGAGSYELACILAPLPPLERDVLPQETAAGASKRWLCQGRPHHMQALFESARTQHTHAYAVSSGEGKR